MDIVWYIVAASMFAQLEKRGPRAGHVLAEGRTANALSDPRGPSHLSEGFIRLNENFLFWPLCCISHALSLAPSLSPFS